MPPQKHGGSLEYIKDAPWNRADPQPERLAAKGPIWTRHPTTGSAYLLKADTSLHRVKPLAQLYPESHALHEG